MKKIILILLLSIMSIIVFGQARLGSSEAEIKTEFSESEYDLKSGYYTDNERFITIKTERAVVTYYFDSSNNCINTLIIPKNQGALNFYVELYNKQYVIISSTEWKMYSSSGVSKIKLVYLENDGYVFAWSY